MIPAVFKFSLVLNLFIFGSLLCAGCRSSRTGILNSSEKVSTDYLKDYESLTGYEELMQMLSVHRDSLYIRIIEYYPPDPGAGDTVLHGPIRSETQIHYSSTDSLVTRDSISEHIQVSDSSFIKQEVEKTAKKEISVSVRPWFDNWQFYLTGGAVIVIILLILIRRFT